MGEKVSYTAQKYQRFTGLQVKLFQVLSPSVGAGTPASLPHQYSATVPPSEVTSDPALLFTATAITVFGVASLIHFFI